MTRYLSFSQRIALVVALLGLVLTADSWALDPGKKKKKKKPATGSAAVTQAIKKVDRQILSYNPEKARELLEPVSEEKDPRVDAEMGRILILEKNYAQASAKLLAASKSSNDPYVLVDLGDSYSYARNQGKAQSSYQEAAQKAQSVLAEKPNASNARFALGVAQQRLKQYDQAVANLEKARAADPRNERIAFELGLTQMLKGNNQAGFDQLSTAVELNSGYAYAYYYRALAAQKIDRKDITVNDLDRFLFLAPDAPEAPKAERILRAARG
jgi:tetratricopeptide (TPR) repeat protein